jgi:hypothetical protein
VVVVVVVVVVMAASSSSSLSSSKFTFCVQVFDKSKHRKGIECSYIGHVLFVSKQFRGLHIMLAGLLHREVSRWPKYCYLTSHKVYAKQIFVFFEDMLPSATSGPNYLLLQPLLLRKFARLPCCF